VRPQTLRTCGKKWCGLLLSRPLSTPHAALQIRRQINLKYAGRVKTYESENLTATLQVHEYWNFWCTLRGYTANFQRSIECWRYIVGELRLNSMYEAHCRQHASIKTNSIAELGQTYAAHAKLQYVGNEQVWCERHRAVKTTTASSGWNSPLISENKEV